MTLTRKELEQMGCGTPGCSHDHSVLFFHGICHPHADVSACYEKASGELVLRCGRCTKLVARVAVAAEI